MLNIDSRLNASQRRQRKYKKQTIEAKSILESQFGEPVYRRIIGQRKFHIRIEGDSNRITAWAVAQRVREARERQGLTQEALAEKTGIARPNVVRLEQGRHLPTISTLQKVARALGLNVTTLIAPPVVTHKDRLEFTEMAEMDLDEWRKQLEAEDAKD